MTLRSRLLSLGLAIFSFVLVEGVAFAQSITSVAVDANATLSNNNTVATVTGAIVCSSDSGGLSLSAIIQQNKAGTDTTGSGSMSGLNCNNSFGPVPFAIQVIVVAPANGDLGKGPAALIFQAEACSASNCTSQLITAKIHLSQ